MLPDKMKKNSAHEHNDPNNEPIKRLFQEGPVQHQPDFFPYQTEKMRSTAKPIAITSKMVAIFSPLMVMMLSDICRPQIATRFG